MKTEHKKRCKVSTYGSWFAETYIGNVYSGYLIDRNSCELRLKIGVNVAYIKSYCETYIIKMLLLLKDK